jgi:hypothetical protein
MKKLFLLLLLTSCGSKDYGNVVDGPEASPTEQPLPPECKGNGLIVTTPPRLPSDWETNFNTWTPAQFDYGVDICMKEVIPMNQKCNVSMSFNYMHTYCACFMGKVAALMPSTSQTPPSQEIMQQWASWCSYNTAKEFK